MAKLFFSFLPIFAMTLSLHAAGERFYIGAYTHPGGSKGIYTCVLDPESGSLGPVTLAAEAHDPSYVAFSPDRRFLYGDTSDSGGSVAAYTVGEDGTLGLLNVIPCGGAGPCHVSVDPSGENVFVANYGDGTVASIRLRKDGGVGELAATHKFTGSGPNPERQREPHAHGVYPDAGGRFLYVCDLGTDKVWIFRGSSLEPANPPFAIVPPGGGPRHLAFSQDQSMAYVNNELGRSVTAFKRDAATGALTPVQTLPLVPGSHPDPKVTTAEIECHPSGKWVYVSSRGDDILAVFAVQPDGTLKFVQDVPAGVKTPRGFGIDPSGRWLVCAGQDDGRLAVFRIAPDSGRLAQTGSQAIGGAPVCIAFLPAKPEEKSGAADPAASAAPAPGPQAIVPGARWLDDRSVQIQAHGGGIVKDGDTYYWFGEDYPQPRQPGMRCVSCYASKDLMHWTFRNQVVRWADPDGLGQDWVLERPKVYPNAAMHRYVMYMHLDSGDYAAARVGVAVCDRIDGNYRFVKSFQPLDNESRDIGQFIDDDGTAYLISEDRPRGFHILRLTADYMDVDKDVCLIPEHLEGGAIVHYDGLYYVVGSHLTWWNPNPNQYATAARLEGPWSEFKDIAPPETNTYNSQSTFLLKIAGSQETSVILMADQWRPGELWDSRYLWMPLEIGGGKARLPVPAPWKIDAATGVVSPAPKG